MVWHCARYPAPHRRLERHLRGQCPHPQRIRLAVSPHTANHLNCWSRLEGQPARRAGNYRPIGAERPGRGTGPSDATGGSPNGKYRVNHRAHRHGLVGPPRSRFSPGLASTPPCSPGRSGFSMLCARRFVSCTQGSSWQRSGLRCSALLAHGSCHTWCRPRLQPMAPWAWCSRSWHGY